MRTRPHLMLAVFAVIFAFPLLGHAQQSTPDVSSPLIGKAFDDVVVRYDPPVARSGADPVRAVQKSSAPRRDE